MKALTSEVNFFQATVKKINMQTSKYTLRLMCQSIMYTVGKKGGWSINEADALIRLIEKKISEI